MKEVDDTIFILDFELNQYNKELELAEEEITNDFYYTHIEIKNQIEQWKNKS